MMSNKLDQLENYEIETYKNYSEVLEQLIRLKAFYLNKGDEKGFHCKRINYPSRVRNYQIKVQKIKINIIIFKK